MIDSQKVFVVVALPNEEPIKKGDDLKDIGSHAWGGEYYHDRLEAHARAAELIILNDAPFSVRKMVIEWEAK